MIPVPRWAHAEERITSQPAEVMVSASVHMVEPMHSALLTPCFHAFLLPVYAAAMHRGTRCDQRASRSKERHACKRDLLRGMLSLRAVTCRECCTPISTAGTCIQQEGTSGSKRAPRGCPIVSCFCTSEGRRAFFAGHGWHGRLTPVLLIARRPRAWHRLLPICTRR